MRKEKKRARLGRTRQEELKEERSSYRKVDTSNAIQNQKDVRVSKLGEAEVHASGEEEDEDVEVEEEGGPCGGLMFRDRGNDGDVILSVCGVEEGVETTSPGGNVLLSQHSSSR